jgi:hypothetical protein
MATDPSKNFGPTKGTPCQLSDLRHLCPKVSLDYMLNRYFVGGGPKDLIAHARIVNFIRIIDSILIDYNNMRDMLDRYVSTINNIMSPLLYAIGHAESCIGNLHRANRLAEAIRRDKNGPQVEKLEVLPAHATKVLEEFRHEIQHLDEKLADGTWQSHEAQCMMLYDDCLEIYGKKILYRDLARWITRLHALSEKLAQYKET